MYHTSDRSQFMSVIQSRWGDQAAAGQRQFERGRATGFLPSKAQTDGAASQKPPAPKPPRQD